MFLGWFYLFGIKVGLDSKTSFIVLSDCIAVILSQLQRSEELSPGGASAAAVTLHAVTKCKRPTTQKENVKIDCVWFSVGKQVVYRHQLYSAW